MLESILGEDFSRWLAASASRFTRADTFFPRSIHFVCHLRKATGELQARWRILLSESLECRFMPFSKNRSPLEEHPVVPGALPEGFDTIGVRVHAVQIRDVVACMEKWISERSRCHSIAPTGMHGIV